MDDYRTLVLLVAVLIIAGIVIDGIRRNRREKRNDLPFMLCAEVQEPADRFTGELPSGGARVVRVGGGAEGRERFDRHDPEFGDLDPFGGADSVGESTVEPPEPREPQKRQRSNVFDTSTKPKLRMRVSAGASGSISQQLAAQQPTADEGSNVPSPESASETELMDLEVHGQQLDVQSVDLPENSRSALAVQPDERPKTKYGVRYQRSRKASEEVARAEREDAFEPAATQPSETILVKLVAGRGKVFDGESLLRCMVSCGLRFNEKERLFYRHEQHNGKGQKLFGLANLSRTGQFDYDTMRTLRTPGVCLYLTLPGPRRSQNALELMVDTARRLAVQLGGDMMDDNNSVITGQTIEHFRQKVVEFERVSMQRLAPA